MTVFPNKSLVMGQENKMKSYLFISFLVCICLLSYGMETETDYSKYIKTRDGLPCSAPNFDKTKVTVLETFGGYAYPIKSDFRGLFNKEFHLIQAYNSYCPMSGGILSVASAKNIFDKSENRILLIDSFAHDAFNNCVTQEQIRFSLQYFYNALIPERDVIFIYSPIRLSSDAYQSDHYKMVLNEYETFAEKYGIPSVNLADFLRDDHLSSGKSMDIYDLTVNPNGAFSPDLTENAKLRTDRSNKLLAQLIDECRKKEYTPDELQTIQAKRAAKMNRDFILSSNYEIDNYPDGWLPWQFSPVEFVQHILVGEGNSVFDYPFKGTSISIIGLADDKSGAFEYSVNDEEWRTADTNVLRGRNEMATFEILLKKDMQRNIVHHLKIRLVDPTKKIRITCFPISNCISLVDTGSVQSLDQIYKRIPPVEFVPTTSILQQLPLTQKRLQNGPELNILLLGDSIVNGIYSSHFEHLIQRMYPQCKITVDRSVRGGTGCWYYQEPEMFKKYVSDKKFDLLMIGGISHKGDTDAIRNVVKKTKERFEDAEIILMTDVFGDIAYLDPYSPTQNEEYRTALKSLSEDYPGCAYMDLTKPWSDYIRNCKMPYTAFKQDPVHGNYLGNHLIARIIEQYFKP